MSIPYKLSSLLLLTFDHLDIFIYVRGVNVIMESRKPVDSP